MRQRLARYWEGEEEMHGDLNTMTPAELFAAWLNWEGIIAYDDSIIRALRESGYIVEAPED